MKKKAYIGRRWLLPCSFALSLLPTLLFYLLRGNQTWMDFWVFRFAAPLEQFLGRIWSAVPFSMAEVFTALAILLSLFFLIRALFRLRKEGTAVFFRRMVALLCAWSWILAGFTWFWNCAYYTSSFAQRVNLNAAPCSVAELKAVTLYFAQQAAQRSSLVARDSDGHFQTSLSECVQTGQFVYDELSVSFPSLAAKSVKVKPLLTSKIQSVLGFTGVYFPFTGEANINIDAPRCLLPATIAHEMAHQRMIASELEASFIGIAACTACDDVTYQYSGYLMGLVKLCNALYRVDPDSWFDIASQTFTPEMSIDWSDNNDYWAALESPVEEAAEQVYDSYLKSNDQHLGIQSYGACVDLLVSYYLPLT